MKKNKQLQKTITRLVEASFREGKIIESQFTRAVKVLKSQPNFAAIQALSEYCKQLKREEKKHTMYIDTVILLSVNQIQKIKKIVEKENKITKVVTRINSSLQGGFKLRVADEIWDKSILGKINQVKEAIISG